MTRLVLNDAEQSVRNMAVDWGELLNELDRDANGRGEAVTAVRFDGVDEPSYRHAAQMGQRVCDIALIEVETATPSDLLDDALTEGARAAGALAAGAGQIGAAFRTAHLVDANNRLAELVEGMGSLMSILRACATARGVSLEQMECKGRPMAARLSELTEQLESIVAAQQSRDWLTVADLLEYEFQPALAAWQPVFDELRSEIPKS